MNVYKRNKLREIMIKKRQEKEAIANLDLDPLIKRINEKRKPTIQPNELPF